jgi:AcrR family transcriptional regulator
MTVGEEIGLRGHRIKNHERMKARRREILLAAAQVFARSGYAYATLDDVATQMGVSRGVIYYYFRSKDELLTEIVTTASGEASDRLEAIIAEGRSADETLEAGLRDLASHMFSDLDRYANILTKSGRERDHSWMTATRAVRHRYRTLIRGVIEAGIRDGAFVDLDPGIMTLSVVQTVLGAVAWYRPEGGLPAEVVAEQMVELAMRSVRQR